MPEHDTPRTRSAPSAIKKLMSTNTSPPILLCISGFDPSGGAGLQADVETATALGVRAVCAQTCNTVQNSQGVERVIATAPEILARQLACLTADFEIAAVKTGLIPSSDNVRVVADAVSKLGQPLIVDPVLRDGTGRSLCAEQTEDAVVRALRRELLPLAACITPNRAELTALVGDSETMAEAARTLLDEQCGAVLVTSAASEAQTLRHILYRHGDNDQFSSPRLSGEFHGSGCTLAAAIAAQLATGKTLREAVPQALAFTTRALERADAPGRHGQTRRLPRRW